MSHPNHTLDHSGNLVTPATDVHPEVTVQQGRSDTNNNIVGESAQATNYHVDEQNTQFPSLYECPITQEPPTLGVTFLDHPQVFEYSAIYRHISTPGRLTALRNVLHPISRQIIPRSEAINHVHYISPQVQSIINQERQSRGLSVNDTNPVTDVDRALYETTMRRIHER